MPLISNYIILVHYSEIALKKNNRSFFEKIFIKNIKIQLKPLPYQSIKLKAARIIIDGIDILKWSEYIKKIKCIMGLKNATLMIETNTDIKSIKSATGDLIKNKEFKNFRISCKRNDKTLSFNSQDINVIIGKHVQEITNKPVNLDDPEFNIIVELLHATSFVGYDKINGYSGLPANCQEKALSLISSGIDSPVASFEMIKRGVDVHYIHFHSYPAINRQSIDNVEKLLKVLSSYQLRSTLFLVPLLDIQQKIMEEIPDKYWVIFFRKAMIKIANYLANKINAVALITGDSIGQVASQTLSNIRSISENTNLPIIRPLSGYNKEDIINRAKEIGTYDISIEPYEDCCSYFVPQHPETKAKIDRVRQLENNLDLNDLLKEVLEKIERKEIK